MKGIMKSTENHFNQNENIKFKEAVKFQKIKIILFFFHCFLRNDVRILNPASAIIFHTSNTGCQRKKHFPVRLGGLFSRLVRAITILYVRQVHVFIRL